jgi:hypothetical protein
VGKARDENENKISTLNSKLQFFSADFYKGRERLRGKIFSDRRGWGGRAGACRWGRVCLSVCLCKSKSYPTVLSDCRRNPPPVWAARFCERWGLGSDCRWIDKRSIPGG